MAVGPAKRSWPAVEWLVMPAEDGRKKSPRDPLAACHSTPVTDHCQATFSCYGETYAPTFIGLKNS